MNKYNYYCDAMVSHHHNVILIELAYLTRRLRLCHIKIVAINFHFFLEVNKNFLQFAIYV